jgi:hypothetical protein
MRGRTAGILPAFARMMHLQLDGEPSLLGGGVASAAPGSTEQCPYPRPERHPRASSMPSIVTRFRMRNDIHPKWSNRNRNRSRPRASAARHRRCHAPPNN